MNKLMAVDQLATSVNCIFYLIKDLDRVGWVSASARSVLARRLEPLIFLALSNINYSALYTDVLEIPSHFQGFEAKAVPEKQATLVSAKKKFLRRVAYVVF